MTNNTDSIKQLNQNYIKLCLDLEQATEDYFQVSQEEEKASQALKLREAEILTTTDPKELGANEKVRAAKIAEYLQPEIAALRAKQEEKSAASFWLEKLKIKRRSLEFTLKCCEISAQGGPKWIQID